MSDSARRAFVCDDEEWLVWASGGGAYGTGRWSLGNVEAVHFARSSAPTQPVLEALLATGRLADLFDDELRALFRSARPVVDASQLPEGVRRKPRARSLQDHGPAPVERPPAQE